MIKTAGLPPGAGRTVGLDRRLPPWLRFTPVRGGQSWWARRAASRLGSPPRAGRTQRLLHACCWLRFTPARGEDERRRLGWACGRRFTPARGRFVAGRKLDGVGSWFTPARGGRRSVTKGLNPAVGSPPRGEDGPSRPGSAGAPKVYPRARGGHLVRDVVVPTATGSPPCGEDSTGSVSSPRMSAVHPHAGRRFVDGR